MLRQNWSVCDMHEICANGNFFQESMLADNPLTESLEKKVAKIITTNILLH